MCLALCGPSPALAHFNFTVNLYGRFSEFFPYEQSPGRGSPGSCRSGGRRRGRLWSSCRGPLLSPWPPLTRLGKGRLSQAPLGSKLRGQGLQGGDVAAGGSVHERGSRGGLWSFQGSPVLAPSPGRPAPLPPGKTLQPLLGESFLGG